VAYPRLDRPAAPSAALPADEIACRKDLKRLGVTFQDLAPIRDGPTCGIDHPVKVSAIGSVTMKPAATLSCRMAATFARWTRKELVPTARWKYLSGVKTIHQGSSYSCRRIARSRTPSQHSVGNALDVMRIELNNGRDIDVRKPGWFAFRQKSFLNTVRADGCDYFTTVLGPGYNYDHRNHFHFDIMPRKNGYVACK
ncbi:MAG: extensin family protein, partial [Pseudaminobacter sp.]